MIHSQKLTRFIWIAAVMLIALGAILAAVVAFGVAPPPPPLTSLAQAFAHMDTTGLPAISRYRAQDGTMLAYRVYPGEGQQVAVLIHGSSGQGSSMNALARTLNGTGATVYTSDVRGHGRSG